MLAGYQPLVDAIAMEQMHAWQTTRKGSEIVIIELQVELQFNELTERRCQFQTETNKSCTSRCPHQPHWHDATFCTCEVACEFRLFPVEKFHSPLSLIGEMF